MLLLSPYLLSGESCVELGGGLGGDETWVAPTRIPNLRVDAGKKGLYTLGRHQG